MAGVSRIHLQKLKLFEEKTNLREFTSIVLWKPILFALTSVHKVMEANYGSKQ